MARTKTPDLREKMLDAAARLFGRRRFHEVRMDDVAAEAGVAKGTLYRYFEDKQAMYLALLTRASGQFIAELTERADAAATARGKLVAVVDGCLAFFDRQPHLYTLIQRAEVAHEQGAAFPWQAARDRAGALLHDIFRQAERDGAFVVRHPEHAILMLLGGLRAVWRTDPQPRPADLAARLVADFLEGAAGPKPDRSHSSR